MANVNLSQKELNSLVHALIMLQTTIEKRTYESVFSDRDGLLYPENKENWEHHQKSDLKEIKKLRKKIYDFNTLEILKICPN